MQTIVQLFRITLLALSSVTALCGAAFGAANDLYVANLTNRIYKITPSGQTTVFAGGFDPYGIAFNPAAEMFSASSNARTIFRVAVDGTSNFATGLGDPLGLAFDRNGDLYAADFSSNSILRFAPNGSRTVFASLINHPDGIAFAPSGDLFVTGFSFGRVSRVQPNGTVTSFATGLVGPVGVACDAAGNAFVAERDGGRISRIAPDGTKSVFSTALSSPYGLAFDGAGNLFVTNQFSGEVFRIAGDGSATLFATISGEAGFIAFEPPTGLLLNVATRARVLAGENVMIGGFIITGAVEKKVIVRAIGPSLAAFGVTDSLQDPIVELHRGDGTTISTNDSWRQSQESQIQASGLAPSDEREAVIVATLPPGAYTAVVRGQSDGTGVGVVEVYDVSNSTASKLANLSTRGFVGTTENVLIGGFIVGAGNGARPLVRAIGPSLAGAGVSNPLPDPVLSVHDSNGAAFATNDNWKESQQIAIEGSTLAPSNDAEAAIVVSLPPGNYTAIVSGKNGGTGVGLVEIYSL